MAQNPTPRTPTTSTSKPANGGPAAKPPNGATAAPAAKKEKRPRVRWVSTTPGLEGLWVRSYKDVTDKFGAPLDPKGNVMVAKAGVPFGQPADPAAKAARLAAKEAEKARIAAMSDEDKFAFAKSKREAKQAETAKKRQQEREALVAQIKAEIAAGKL